MNDSVDYFDANEVVQLTGMLPKEQLRPPTDLASEATQRNSKNKLLSSLGLESDAEGTKIIGSITENTSYTKNAFPESLILDAPAPGLPITTNRIIDPSLAFKSIPNTDIYKEKRPVISSPINIIKQGAIQAPVGKKFNILEFLQVNAIFQA